MNTLNSKYFEQVRMLIDLLPLIAPDSRFALKGGTAINLFVFDMPRLSVDIDLCYLPLTLRDQALNDIGTFIRDLSERLESLGFKTSEKKNIEGYESTLFVQSKKVAIKIEINLVVRSAVYQPVLRRLSPQVREHFARDAEVLCLDNLDLFAGKICAALDRQHPRDFFDLWMYFKHFSYTRALHQTLMVYLLSSKRPLAELIKPNLLDVQSSYNTQFEGMSTMTISPTILEETRAQVFENVLSSFTDQDKEFLISFKKGEPQWDLFSIENVQHFPAVQWKLYNIRAMSTVQRKKALDFLIKQLEF
jgi:predicted nucleotidyltransferase component of viral defense system